MTTTDLVQRENEKRQRCVPAHTKWEHIQAAITFAESQLSDGRNTPAACKANERMLLSRTPKVTAPSA